MALTFTDANFDEEVLKSDKPVLVDFFATWCGPCQMMAPEIDALAKDVEGKFKVGKLDVDASPETAGKYGVQSIPTIIIFKEGKEVDKLTGFKPKEDLKKALEAL